LLVEDNVWWMQERWAFNAQKFEAHHCPSRANGYTFEE